MICVSVFSFAQTAVITDSATGKPILGATLLSQKPNAFAVTNAKGMVGLKPFSQAEAIEIRSLGYETQVTSYEELKIANFQIKLVPMNINLDEVVIAATRWNQSTRNVPSAVVSISSKEMAFQNPQNAADLLGISGKVFIQKSQQGGGSPMIRGFATNRLIYTVDGVRMNNAIFRGGNIQNVINLDPFAIEKTEVVFGPGSVVYGSDAIGGAMSFQTLTPQLSLTNQPLILGKGVARYASANNEQTGHFDVNLGWKKWAVVTSFSSWDFDHLRQGSNGPDDYIKEYFVQRLDSSDVIVSQSDHLLQIPSAYRQMNLMQKVRYKPSDHWDIQYGLHFSQTSPYGRYDRHNRTRNNIARYAEWNYGPQKWLMNNLSVSHIGVRMYDQATLRLAQQHFEESRISRDLNAETREERVENVSAYSANLDFSKSLSKQNTLFYGIEYVLNDVASRGSDVNIYSQQAQNGSSRYPNSKWQSIAAFISDEYRISESFTLQAGLRYNHFKLEADFSENLAFYPLPFDKTLISNGAITGSFGGVYRPLDDLVVKVNFGTAFRSPNVDDIGKVFDSEPGAVTVPNPNLDAEKAYNFDIGVAKVFGEVVKLDLTGYYTKLNNAMVRRNYLLNEEDSILYDGVLSQVQAIQNAASANVYGIQAGLEVKLPEGFSLSSDFNFQKGEEELDDGSLSPSRHAAPVFGATRLNYQKSNLKLQLYANYQGKRTYEELSIDERNKDEIYAKDKNGNNYSPSWYTLNFKSMYEISDNLKFTVGIENLTDQRYRPYSSGISGAGRNFILSITAKF